MSDELSTAVITAAVTRISGVAALTRVRSRKSLGEIMVLAHASVLAQGGLNVIVLTDEQDGRDRAVREQGWLRCSAAPGQLALWSTKQVLKQAQPAWIAGGLTWQQVYEQMRPFDAGLRRCRARRVAAVAQCPPGPSSLNSDLLGLRLGNVHAGLRWGAP